VAGEAAVVQDKDEETEKILELEVFGMGKRVTTQSRHKWVPHSFLKSGNLEIGRVVWAGGDYKKSVSPE